MLEFHRRLAEVALPVVERYGFVLAGGYAIALHGFGDRPSADVDLFTADADPVRFDTALAALRSALAVAGFEVTDLRVRPLFADLNVYDPHAGVGSDLQLGMNYRGFPPHRLDLGAVLDVRDAIGAKMSALYGRGEARDFIDIELVLASGRYTRDDILALGDSQEATAMDRAVLADQFRAAARWAPTEYARYGVDAARRQVIVNEFVDWADLVDPRMAPEAAPSPWEAVQPMPPAPADEPSASRGQTRPAPLDPH
jgi:Nucleotidyl transferase AbiEii toxin, Type IV TA system